MVGNGSADVVGNAVHLHFCDEVGSSVNGRDVWHSSSSGIYLRCRVFVVASVITNVGNIEGKKFSLMKCDQRATDNH